MTYQVDLTPVKQRLAESHNREALSPAITKLSPTLVNLPPNDAYRIGAGINVSTGELSAVSALKDEPHVKKVQANTLKKNVFQVCNDEEFKRTLDISGEAQLNISLSKNSFSTQYLNDISYSETSISYVCLIQDESSVYSELVNRPELSEQGLKLQDEDAINGSDSFRRTFGDYYISGSKVGSKLVGVYTCKASTSKELNEFKSSMESTYGGLFSVKANQKFKQEASKYNVSIELKIHMLGADLPKDSSVLSDLQKAEDWFMSNRNPVEVVYMATHYATIPGSKLKMEVNCSHETFARIGFLRGEIQRLQVRYASLPGNRAKFNGDYEYLLNTYSATKNALTNPDSEKTLDDLILRCEELHMLFDNQYAKSDFIKTQINSKEPKGKVDMDRKEIYRTGFTSTDAPENLHDVHLVKFVKEYKIGYRIGHRTHEFDFKDDSLIAVGYEIESKKEDNGYFQVKSGKSLGTSELKVSIRSGYDRGINYKVTVYAVKRNEFNEFI